MARRADHCVSLSVWSLCRCVRVLMIIVFDGEDRVNIDTRALSQKSTIGSKSSTVRDNSQRQADSIDSSKLSKI